MTGLCVGFECREVPAGYGVAGAITGEGLPTTNDRVDVGRINLDPVAAPTGAFSRNDRSPAAQEGVEHHVTTARAVQDGIGHHGFYGRVQLKEVTFIGAPAERIGAV